MGCAIPPPLFHQPQRRAIFENFSIDGGGGLMGVDGGGGARFIEIPPLVENLGE
jgi:hypothetical protein